MANSEANSIAQETFTHDDNSFSDDQHQTQDEISMYQAKVAQISADSLPQKQNHTCQLNSKASQTCLCSAQNDTTQGDQRTRWIDTAGQLKDLQEEEEEEDNKKDQANDFDGERNEAPPLPEPNPKDQLRVLRDLLRLERENNDKRRRNNAAMQRYVHQMQMDYLRQQRELIESLEFGNKLKAHKDSQMATIECTLSEKNNLIEQLRRQLDDLDEQKLRSHFKETLDKQQQMARLQEQQFRLQLEQLEQQLAREKANNEQHLDQWRAKLDDQMQLHEREMVPLRARLDQQQTELTNLLNEPQNLVIRSLKEKNAQLQNQLDELSQTIGQSQSKYELLEKRLEHLLAEQDQTELRHQEEIERLQTVHQEQRHHINELKLELDDKQEIIHVLQFNLQRSEKRVKSLIGVLKSKEETYKQLVAQIESKGLQEIDRVNIEMNSMQKQLLENRAELMKRQNELVKLRMEHDNLLESMQNDRDERINKCMMDKQKADKDLRALEIRLVHEVELNGAKCRQIEQLQKDVAQFKAESKRLLIELTQSEAKLYSRQKEFNELQERHTNFIDKHKMHAENGDDHQQQLERLNLELDEEKRISNRYKNQLETFKKDHEKLCVKLRIAEANLIKMTSSINREHSRMLHDFEKKIEQMRSERVVFDQNKLRYSRNGYKLKKYCEHLRKVHNHICNPTNCGYLIGTLKVIEDAATACDKKLNEDKASLLQDSDGCYSGAENCSLVDYSDLEQLGDNGQQQQQQNKTGQMRTMGFIDRNSLSKRQRDKFIIKRTSGISGSTASAPGSMLTLAKKPIRACSSSASTNTARMQLKAANRNDQHDYCYIKEGSFRSQDSRVVI